MNQIKFMAQKVTELEKRVQVLFDMVHSLESKLLSVVEVQGVNEVEETNGKTDEVNA